MMLAACAILAHADDNANFDGLIGHWPLNEGEGYVLRDLAGRAGDGEQIGAEWAPLGNGSCLRLGVPFKEGLDLGRPPGLFSVRGADRDGYAYLRLPLKNLCRMGNQGELRHKTLSLWIKPVNGGIADPTQGDRVVVFYGGNFMITLSQAESRLSASIISGENRVSITAPAPDGSKWTHLAVTHDDVFARFFVDGRAINADQRYMITNVRFPPSDKWGGRGMYVSTSLIGRDQMRPYAGFVSDIRFYNRAFTDADARLEYQAGLAAHLE